jgi:hypothetical protein
MKRYKVIRISLVSAESKSEAIEKVKANPAAYLDMEFAKEAEEGGGWGKSLKSQFFGGKR